ncbi:MAG: YqjF family protein [bacterium]
MKTRPTGSTDFPWVLSMQWYDVLFLHWPVPRAVLRPYVPDGLDIESHAGSTWLGIVPFRMSDIRPRWLPPVSCLSDFPELNIRTYVTDGEVSGVWFFSLDACSWLSVRIARLAYSLNYYHADMSVETGNNLVRYASRRRKSEPGDFRFKCKYQTAESNPIDKGDLERFLTERYFLFSQDDCGSLYRGRILHPEWELFKTDYEIGELYVKNHPSPPDDTPVSALYSPHLSVKAWLPVSLGQD